MSSVRVAVAAWKLRAVRGDGDFYGHFHDLVTIAHDEGAQVVVIPEGHTLELLHLAPDLEERDIPAFLAQFAGELEAWIDRISRSSGLTIVGGSHLRLTSDGVKAVCAVGNGEHGLILVEKNKLTTYERDVWRLRPGRGVAAMPDPRLAVLVGYDSEFPEASRLAGERGAQVIAVPAWARDLRAFHRLRWCAHARAIENQMFVIHASLAGSIDREPVPSTYGASAILSPSIEPFPQHAVLGETEYGEEEVLVRTLDLDLIEEVRAHGVVRNWEDRASDAWSWEPLELEDESA